MKENTQEKMLVKVNENSIFYKIKKFFISLFDRRTNNSKTSINASEPIDTKQELINENSFRSYIKNIENEETKLLDLQKQYRSGEIKEEELTEEQVKSLCDLYDKQIENLRKSNEIRKEKLLEYRRKLQTNN